MTKANLFLTAVTDFATNAGPNGARFHVAVWSTGGNYLSKSYKTRAGAQKFATKSLYTLVSWDELQAHRDHEFHSQFKTA